MNVYYQLIDNLIEGKDRNNFGYLFDEIKKFSVIFIFLLIKIYTLHNISPFLNKRTNRQKILKNLDY